MIDHRYGSIGQRVAGVYREGPVDRSIVRDRNGSATGELIYPSQGTGQRIINGRGGLLLEHSKRWTRRGGVVLWGWPTLNHTGCHYDVDSSSWSSSSLHSTIEMSLFLSLGDVPRVQPSNICPREASSETRLRIELYGASGRARSIVSNRWLLNSFFR